MTRLTKSFIDKLPLPPRKPGGSHTQKIYRDSALPGFGFRVWSGGAKSFIVEKRIKGKVKRITLGRYGALTCEQARKQAQVVLGDIAQGKDPVAEKRAVTMKATTLADAYQDYLTTRKDLKPTTLHDYQRCIEGSLGDWLKTPLIDLSKEMVEQRHRQLGRRSPARANNTMRVLRAILNFAIEQYEDRQGQPLLSVNPVNRLSKNRAWYDIKRRQTLLTPTQLRPWYESTLQLNQDTTRDYLHFILFTGLRRSEATRLTWDAVDFDERSFLIPETKNNEPHRLPMSDVLFELLQRRHLAAEKIWVFPSPIADGPLKEPRTAIGRMTALTGITFTLHDLRRTFITVAESLDIPAYALKRLLNHKTHNDVTAGYIVPSVDRLREPMQRITDYLKEHMAYDQTPV